MFRKPRPNELRDFIVFVETIFLDFEKIPHDYLSQLSDKDFVRMIEGGRYYTGVYGEFSFIAQEHERSCPTCRGRYHSLVRKSEQGLNKKIYGPLLAEVQEHPCALGDLDDDEISEFFLMEGLDFRSVIEGHLDCSSCGERLKRLTAPLCNVS